MLRLRASACLHHSFQWEGQFKQHRMNAVILSETEPLDYLRSLKNK